ncbi:uncharacterized protein LOC110007552 [Amborella trichopoda]|uniref:uncharacterized protein LOC110007552 n=1 Tax=Amborella trichopoda TaxID=13333 RepID=UPI0009BF5838|nr:uncharacterized protein LOC110007552 [Amborella trichopoda]|eukprot:XP_020524744.1 uncharacterized protein LOC110007552 [Amborella trichopoda]
MANSSTSTVLEVGVSSAVVALATPSRPVFSCVSSMIENMLREGRQGLRVLPFNELGEGLARLRAFAGTTGSGRRQRKHPTAAETHGVSSNSGRIRRWKSDKRPMVSKLGDDSDSSEPVGITSDREGTPDLRETPLSPGIVPDSMAAQLETKEDESPEAAAPDRGSDVDVSSMLEEFSASTVARAMARGEELEVDDVPEHQEVAAPMAPNHDDEGTELFGVEVLAVEGEGQVREATAKDESVGDGKREGAIPELDDDEATTKDCEEQGKQVLLQLVGTEVEVPIREGPDSKADIEELIGHIRRQKSDKLLVVSESGETVAEDSDSSEPVGIASHREGTLDLTKTPSSPGVVPEFEAALVETEEDENPKATAPDRGSDVEVVSMHDKFTASTEAGAMGRRD